MPNRSTTLPFIKREAIVALDKGYPDKLEARAGIKQHLEQFYQSRYPQVSKDRGPAVAKAIEMIKSIYEGSIFPEMKTDWRSHPNNVGHLNSSGCFRCYDGYHVNEAGKAITSDCNTCHTFLYRQGQSNTIVESKFHHEMKINNLWEGFGHHKNLQCQICHTGALTALEPQATTSSCGDCHPSAVARASRESPFP